MVPESSTWKLYLVKVSRNQSNLLLTIIPVFVKVSRYHHARTNNSIKTWQLIYIHSLHNMVSQSVHKFEIDSWSLPILRTFRWSSLFGKSFWPTNLSISDVSSGIIEFVVCGLLGLTILYPKLSAYHHVVGMTWALRGMYMGTGRIRLPLWSCSRNNNLVVQ